MSRRLSNEQTNARVKEGAEPDSRTNTSHDLTESSEESDDWMTPRSQISASTTDDELQGASAAQNASTLQRANKSTSQTAPGTIATPTATRSATRHKRRDRHGVKVTPVVPLNNTVDTIVISDSESSLPSPLDQSQCIEGDSESRFVQSTKKLNNATLTPRTRKHYTRMIQKGQGAEARGDYALAERCYLSCLELYDGDDALTMRVLALCLKNGIARIEDFSDMGLSERVTAKVREDVDDDVIVID